MKNERLTLIGGGNMAEAILRGILESGVAEPGSVTVCDISSERRETLSRRYAVSCTESSAQAIAASPMVLLAVKPDVLGIVLDENRQHLADKAVVSIAAGWTMTAIRERLGGSARLLRVMPNTPAMVGEGMSVLSADHTLRDGEAAYAHSIFSALGRVLTLPEKYFDAVTAVSGSGPAYVYLFIEALADGGVKQGLPRAAAIELSAQTVLGAAKMVLDSGSHPGALKDAVCSPGGTTIEAVYALENAGFRGAVMKAVERCAEKSRSLR